MAAVSFLVHLTPEEAVPQLEERARLLAVQIEQTHAGLKFASGFVDRINLVESEYLLAMLTAELAWVRTLTEDVRQGLLGWDLGRILEDARPQTEAAGRNRESGE